MYIILFGVTSVLDSIGIVESVKGASDVFSPVSGTILEANKDLLKSPSLLNKDPFQQGIYFGKFSQSVMTSI